jgi:hypothetical protein
MKPLVLVAAAVAALTVGTVASAGPPQVVPYEPPQVQAQRCPEVMRGVALVFRPIPGGIALEFSSPRQHEVPELRKQLREAALVVEQHSKAPMQVSAGDSESIRIPPLDISVNDVGAGARVVIRAQRARDVPELLELARALELFWAHSDCHEEIGTRPRMPPPYQRA